MCSLDHIFSRASSLKPPQISHLYPLFFHSNCAASQLISPSGPVRPGYLGIAWRDVLLFPNTVEELVVPVGHDQVHTQQVVNGTETACWEVTLYSSCISPQVRSINSNSPSTSPGQFQPRAHKTHVPYTGRARSPPRAADLEAWRVRLPARTRLLLLLDWGKAAKKRSRSSDAGRRVVTCCL